MFFPEICAMIISGRMKARLMHIEIKGDTKGNSKWIK